MTDNTLQFKFKKKGNFGQTINVTLNICFFQTQNEF